MLNCKPIVPGSPRPSPSLAAKLIPFALVLAGCGGVGAGPQGGVQAALATAPGWNASWDRFDPGPLDYIPVVASNGSTWDMVYVGADGHMYDRSSSDGVHFGAAEDLGGEFKGTPAAVYVGSTLFVAAINYFGSSVSARLRAGQDKPTWENWQNIKGYITSDGLGMAATGWRVHVFGVGGDNALWEITGVGGFWDSGWVSRGGALDAAVAPRAVSWGGSRIDVIAAAPRAYTPGNPDLWATPWHFWEDGSTIGGWESLGGQMRLSSPTVASWGVNRLDFFVQGTDNAIYQRTFDKTWGAWAKVTDCAESFGASAVSVAAGQIDLYVLGMDHAAVWHNRYSATPSMTAGPAPFCCGLPGMTCCPPEDQRDACRGQNNTNVYCSPATDRCEQCGTAVGQACCSLNGFPACGYYGSPTVCNIYSHQCDTNAGGPYQLCIDGPNGSGKCDPGNICTGRDVDHGVAGYCKPLPQPACSRAGGSCSSNATCCSGLQCVSGTCASPSGATTCGGNPIGASTQQYEFGVRDPNSHCAVGTVTAWANSQSEAQSCAQKLAPGWDVLSNQFSEAFPYAQYSPIGTCNDLAVPAFSQSDADTCAYYQCVNCANVRGTCP